MKIECLFCKKNGEDLTNEFYKIMFNDYPDVKPTFNMEKQISGEQPKALDMAILMAVKNLENIRKFVDKVAITHLNLGVKEEHYPIVGAWLLKAIKNLLILMELLLKLGKLVMEKLLILYQYRKNLYEK